MSDDTEILASLNENRLAMPRDSRLRRETDPPPPFPTEPHFVGDSCVSAGVRPPKPRVSPSGFSLARKGNALLLGRSCEASDANAGLWLRGLLSERHLPVVR